MFTGLVDSIGEIQQVARTADGARFHVACGYDALVLGESIAVNGVCLTVVSTGAERSPRAESRPGGFTRAEPETGSHPNDASLRSRTPRRGAQLDGGFWADASTETLDKTNLGELKSGGRVHLERAVRLGDRMGGHLVTGHVDGVGRIVSRTPLGEAVRVTFEVPESLAPFFAPKGSATIDGVSLTVNGAAERRFDVALVPFTRSETLFDHKPVGARVNLEVDVLAKYVARLLGRPGVDGVDPGQAGDEGGLLESLRKGGYV